VKELVTMHRRKISLVSNEATGTMFTAYLPLKKEKKRAMLIKIQYLPDHQQFCYTRNKKMEVV
jgi:hypothetical protein